MPENFIREAEVSVQHLAGGTDEFAGFRTEFEIVQSQTDDTDLSHITLYNVNPERIVDFQTGDIVVLRTGYANSGVERLHLSRLVRARHQSAGASNRMRLAIAEVDLQNTTINAAQAGRYPVRYAARDICNSANIPIDFEELDAVVPLSLAVDNWSASGRAVDVMNDLLTPIGAKCKVVAGEARFYQDGEPDPLNRVFEVSEATGMVGSPVETTDGIRVQVLLNPAMEPGISVDIVARHTNGRFKVVKVVHRGDTGAGGAWVSQLDCVLR